MPQLHVLKGANEGALIPLDGDSFILGRNPDSEIHIPFTSVSREHAQIVRVQGRFYIDDLQSRNGTFVNNQAVHSRTLLKNNDRIRICDFLAAFLENAAFLSWALPGEHLLAVGGYFIQRGELRFERLLPPELAESFSLYVGVAWIRSDAPAVRSTQGYGGLIYRP